MVIEMENTFKIGDRVCFTNYGILIYGYIINQVEQHLYIQSDDCRLYEKSAEDVINLSKEIKEVSVIWDGGFETLYTYTFIDNTVQQFSINDSVNIKNLEGGYYMNSNKEALKTFESKSMSDPVSKVEMALKNSANDIKPIAIKECKYLLPCGKCDKTNEMCSQYER